MISSDSEKTLLAVNDLRIVFNGSWGTNTAVKDVSFRLRKGQTLAVVGESGSGKSVTALALTQLLPPPPQRAAYPERSGIKDSPCSRFQAGRYARYAGKKSPISFKSQPLRSTLSLP